MPVLEVEPNVEIYYEDIGDGSPVVLIHEFAGSHRSWAEQVDVFQTTHRTVVYSCRGYPPSSVPTDSRRYSQHQSISDLAHLLTHLKLDHVALVGLSMGGSIALNFSLKYPERVSNLVIVGTGSGSDGALDFATQFNTVADRILREGIRPVAIEYLTGPTRLPLKRKRPDAWSIQFNEFCSLSPQGLANTIRGAILPRPTIYSLKESLKQLHVPTLIIAGDEDEPTVKPSLYLAENLPNSTLEIFEGTGHIVNLEEPERFNRTVLGFVDNS